MYTYKSYKFPSVIMHEYYFKGNYGAKGEKRKPKREFTPEEIKQHNQKHKEKTVQLLILDNFTEGDYFVTLTYRKDVKKTLPEVNKDVRSFLAKLRRAYKRKSATLKFIYRIEIGSRGGVHIHIILNRIPDTDLLISEKWTNGHAHNELITSEDPTFLKLAEYMTKPPTDKAVEILKIVGQSEDLSKIIRYSCSRNLSRPAPETHTYSNRKMNRILNAEIKPTDGYYIDRDIKPPNRGINPYTGWSYLTYQEIRLTTGVKSSPVRFCECPLCHQFTLDNIVCDCKKIRKRGARHG